ncbi:unnamed protein product [Notodromas monacha]|uniref:Uncharacterized protein n=1 Tax=Notodromas monacha TaxID=399045 RepID=A0A7R9BMZ1_9CRUS|nr:unnamed protein product [Notodromas monacha]CAG0917609.1 unnamed protein product [Notodromas monacha]
MDDVPVRTPSSIGFSVFINTIVCEECYHYSQSIGSFLDILLPILDKKVLRHGTKHEDEGEPSDLLQSKKKKLEKLGRKPKGRAKELLKKEQRRQSAQQKSVVSKCSKNDELGTAEDVKPASALLLEHETPDSISASADEADEESFNSGDVEDNLDT